MFTRTRHAPAPGGVDLRSLRLSLNTPVVARPDFPVGPAAAALVVFGGPGGLHVALALRAVRGGHVALLAPDVEDALDDPWLAVDAALARAEAVGFLFDEELVGPRGEVEAARRAWTDFLAEPPALEAAAAQASGPHSAVLSKFRLRAGSPARAGRREASWVRLLARY